MLNHFVRGIIDGLLSTLGVVIGASAADKAIILSAGIGGAVANGVSNFLGAFSSEEYKGQLHIQKIEEAMLSRGIEESEIGKSMKKERIKAGLLDGSSTIIGGFIPVLHTCQGADVSPSLEWNGAPTETRGLALVLEDPDAPAGVWCHWLLYDVGPKIHNLAQGFRPGALRPDGTVAGE